MNDKAKARIAAIMALLNLGHRDNFSMVRACSFPDGWSGDAASDICMLAAHLIENDRMEAVFMREANIWTGVIDSFPTDEYFTANFHHEEWWIKEVLDRVKEKA